MVKLKRELEWECNHHMFYRYFCDVQIVKIMKQRWKSKTYTIFILYYNNDTRWANKEFNRNVLVVAENSSWNSVDLVAAERQQQVTSMWCVQYVKKCKKKNTKLSFCSDQKWLVLKWFFFFSFGMKSYGNVQLNR